MATAQKGGLAVLSFSDALGASGFRWRREEGGGRGTWGRRRVLRRKKQHERRIWGEGESFEEKEAA